MSFVLCTRWLTEILFAYSTVFLAMPTNMVYDDIGGLKL